MKRSAAVVALALLLAPIASARAATLAGVAVPDSQIVGDQALTLSGVALRTKYIFKVYVAALYLKDKQSDAAAILDRDSARRMEMHFLRSLSAAQICEGWKEGLAANSPQAGPDLVKAFDDLCAAMAPVAEGAKLTLTYVPGLGTAVEIGGKAGPVFPGKPFADALLGCWIGPKPGPGEDFKRALLAP
ncbi:MAG: chalcone isomerase family protein [Thermoanaerobaculia bacterium]